jgi:hypothetical protein
VADTSAYIRESLERATLGFLADAGAS